MADPRASQPVRPDGSAPPSGERPGDRSAAATISFQCPNGHRINVPAKFAGKRGACSKCGTAVVIPLASSAAAPGPAQSGRATSAPTDTVAADDEAGGGDEGTITLTSAPPWPIFAGTAPGHGDGAGRTPQGASGGSGAVPTRAAAAPEGVGQAGGAGDAQQGFHDGWGDNPTAALFARLWAERDHGGIVELHLVGGSVILPEWYESRWSIGSHGLFASQAADGSVTLTAVAWESIQKVIVRQVEGLPDGMFE